jgi:hypothetical protein
MPILLANVQATASFDPDVLAPLHDLSDPALTEKLARRGFAQPPF